MGGYKKALPYLFDTLILFKIFVIINIKLKFNGKDIYIYVLFEFQTTVDRQMPVRLVNYEMKFILETWNDLKTVPPILPIVVYIGQTEWNVSTKFQDLIDNPIPALEKYLVHFEHLLIDVNKFDKRKLVQMRNAAGRLFYIERLTKEDIEKDRNLIIEILKIELGEAGDIIRNYIINLMIHEGVNKELINQVIENTQKEGSKMFAVALEGWAEDLKFKAKIETAKNMQKKGYKTEEIAEIIELPIIEIKKALDIH